jgi:FLVCR family feline leukemia virus subgroup C receptor-related protein
VKEASSQGVLLLNGHFMGALLLILMGLQGGAYLEQVLMISVALLFSAMLGVLFLKESPMIITEEERLQAAVDKEPIRRV